MQHANPRTALAKWKGKKAGEEWGGWGGEAEREFTRPRGEEWGWGVQDVGGEGEDGGDDMEVEVEVEDSPNGDSLYGSGSDLSFEALEELKLLREGQRRRRALCLGGGQEKGQEQSEDGSLAARPVQEEKVSEAWWTAFPGKPKDAQPNEAKTNEPKPKCKWSKKANRVLSKTKNFLVKVGYLKHLHGESAR